MAEAQNTADLTEAFLDRLDDELLAIRDDLTTGKRLTAVKVVLRNLIDKTTEREIEVGSEPDRLFCRGWKEAWLQQRRVFSGPTTPYERSLEPRQLQYLNEVRRAMVQFVVDGENTHLLHRFGQSLQVAIDDYLSTRGILGSVEKNPRT